MTPSGLTDDDRDALRDWWDEDETASVESSFPIIARIVARERAEALREAADEWQWGAWTVLTPKIKAASQPQRIIGAAQAVTDWLRVRADRETP